MEHTESRKQRTK